MFKFKSLISYVFNYLLVKIFCRKNIFMDSNEIRLSFLPYVGKNASLFFLGKFVSRDSCSIQVTKGTVTIGKRVFFNRNVSINCQDTIIIGNDCMFGHNVSIYDHDHVFKYGNIPFREQGFKSSPVNVGNNVWLGCSVTILKGSKIGNNVVICAGAIVKGDIPDNTIVKSENELYFEKINFMKNEQQ